MQTRLKSLDPTCRRTEHFHCGWSWGTSFANFMPKARAS